MARKSTKAREEHDDAPLEVIVTPQGDLRPKPPPIQWTYWGDDAAGRRYETSVDGKRRRAVPEGGNVLQQAWLDGGEWDGKADQQAAKEAAKEEEAAREAEAP